MRNIIMKCGTAWASLTIALLTVPELKAQAPKELSPAPLPKQIFSARKVFVSNAGADTRGEYGGGPERAYNQLYAGLKGLGRYELVATPADAELIFEISFTIPFVGEHIYGGSATPVIESNGYGSPFPASHCRPQDTCIVVDLYRACAASTLAGEPR